MADEKQQHNQLGGAHPVPGQAIGRRHPQYQPQGQSAQGHDEGVLEAAEHVVGAQMLGIGLQGEGLGQQGDGLGENLRFGLKGIEHDPQDGKQHQRGDKHRRRVHRRLGRLDPWTPPGDVRRRGLNTGLRVHLHHLILSHQGQIDRGYRQQAQEQHVGSGRAGAELVFPK